MPPERRRLVFSGAPLILVATVVSGLSGYLVTGVVAAALGPADYAVFAIFWAALYLLVGTLSGVQQEVTRAAHPVEGEPLTGANGRDFGLLASGAVFVAVLVSGFFWGPLVFPSAALGTVVVLAFGAAAYVAVAVISGVLYGLSLWPLIGSMVALDGLFRLVFVGVALVFGWGGIGLEIAAALPFVAVPLVLWAWIRPRTIKRYVLDVPLGRLTWNAARTLLAAASTAVLISGFPMIVGATSADVPKAAVGALILAITLTRAPLVVTSLALQSYFVVLFRSRLDSPRRFWMLMAALCGVVVVAATAFALLVWWLGSPVLTFVFGAGYAVDGGALALLVAAAGLVALLSVCGSGLLVRGQHFAYAASWVVAAVVTVAVMLTDLPLTDRVIASLTLGPLIGLGVQLVANALAVRRVQASTDIPSA